MEVSQQARDRLHRSQSQQGPRGCHTRELYPQEICDTGSRYQALDSGIDLLVSYHSRTFRSEIILSNVGLTVRPLQLHHNSIHGRLRLPTNYSAEWSKIQ